MIRAFLRYIFVFASFAAPLAAHAQPVGWTYSKPFTVTETSGAALANYQVQVTLDTAALIAGGQMRADAGDLRFGTDISGATLMDYWIESGVNTASTVVWIKVPSLPASSTVPFFYFHGNPAATSLSTTDVFDFTSLAANTGTAQTSNTALSGSANAQRGYRFTVTEDILLTDLGKFEPSANPRYVTVFDFVTQAILAQAQVTGPTATWSYTPAPSPLWLRAGTQYLVEIFFPAGDDAYYFGATPTTSAKVQYVEMRYCNGCTQNTFPVNSLGGMHYGYVDFVYRTRQHATSEPTVQMAPIPTSTAVVGAPSPSFFGANVTFTATISGATPATGTVDFLDGAVPICAGVVVAANQATCTTSTLALGGHTINANYSGSIDIAASSGNTAHTVLSPAVNVYTAPSATGSGIISASFTGGGALCTYNTPQYIGSPPGVAPVPPTKPSSDIEFPHGMFDFRVTGCTVGSTVTFTIVYPSNLPPSTNYWKYGPTAGNIAPHWYVLPAVIAGNTATFSITDGGLGDDDLTADGVIIDQGGPGVGGAQSVPALDRWALLLLSLMIFGFAWQLRRVRTGR